MKNKQLLYGIGLMAVIWIFPFLSGWAANIDHGEKEGKAARAEPITNDGPFVPALGFHLGTQGLGFTFYGPLGGNFGFHVGGTVFPLRTYLYSTFGSYATRNKIKATTGNVHAVIDFAPAGHSASFMKHFVISAGGAYFYKEEGEFTTKLRYPYQYGDILVPNGQVGVMVTDVEWDNKFAPYLGLGLHNITIDEKFGFGLDLGTYYMGRPSVSLYGTRMLQNNQHNAAIIYENLKDYRFYPVLQVSIAYKFK